MLYQLGPHVHRDPLLLAKILRLGRAFLKEWGGNGPEGELPSQERVCSCACLVYFPVISVMPHVYLYTVCKIRVLSVGLHSPVLAEAEIGLSA